MDPAHLEFLEQTRATLHFDSGKPIGIDFYPIPASSLRLQTHGWTLLEVIALRWLADALSLGGATCPRFPHNRYERGRLGPVGERE